MAKSANKKPQELLFYDKPALITTERHKESGLSKQENYLFAKNTNSVVITVSEVIEASKDYPIVFSTAPKPEIFCVLGFENNKNLFVNADGLWAKNKYIPAYMRRYPFAFFQKDEKLLLCVDESSDRFSLKAKKSDLPFFNGEEKSPLTNRALEFCLSYHNDKDVTEKFTKEIQDSGILKPTQLNVQPKGKAKPTSLTGFQVVDEKKFRELDPKKVVEWHKAGYLSLLYFHLQSLSNFNALTRI